MKKYFYFLIAAVQILFSFAHVHASPGIGGSGGGPAVGSMVTVEVCDGGESGDICRKVTYRVREPSKAEPVKCMIPHGEAGEVPCPTSYGVPKWLKRLNEGFGKREARVVDDQMVGGP